MDACIAVLEKSVELLREISQKQDGLASYRRSLQGIVAALWRGDIDLGEFVAGYTAIIERGYTQAWLEGAARCGVGAPSTLTELTGHELTVLRQETFNDLVHIVPFGEAIVEAPRGVGKLSAFNNRLNMWANRYRLIQQLGERYACGNKKKMFKIGPTEEHCQSCGGLNNRVYRLETWQKNNAVPPNRCFSCGGYHCLCTLEDTNGRITPGRFPRRLIQC